MWYHVIGLIVIITTSSSCICFFERSRDHRMFCPSILVLRYTLFAVAQHDNFTYNTLYSYIRISDYYSVRYSKTNVYHWDTGNGFLKNGYRGFSDPIRSALFTHPLYFWVFFSASSAIWCYNVNTKHAFLYFCASHTYVISSDYVIIRCPSTETRLH